MKFAVWLPLIVVFFVVQSAFAQEGYSPPATGGRDASVTQVAPDADCPEGQVSLDCSPDGATCAPAGAICCNKETGSVCLGGYACHPADRVGGQPYCTRRSRPGQRL